MLFPGQHGDPEIDEAGVAQRILNRVDFVVARPHPIELRRIGREKLGHDFVGDAGMPVGVAVPNAKYIAAPGGEHAIRLAVGFLLVREELNAELADHRVKAGVAKRQCHRIGVLELERLIGAKLVSRDDQADLSGR